MLYCLVVDKEESLRSMFDRKVSEGNWECLFKRRLYDWEVAEVIRLRNYLVAAPICVADQFDCPMWKASSSGEFSVRSIYQGLLASASPQLRVSKLVWLSYVPPKVQFFTWLAWRGKVKTSVFLYRIGVLPSNVSTLCVFCKSENESVNHVLVSCPFVWRVWSAMLGWWDLEGALPDSVEGILLWWNGQWYRRIERKIWRGIPLVVLWSVWKHWNDCVFNASAPNWWSCVK